MGRPLFTDIAHTVYNPQLPTFVHTSGCHGIEGYLGSSIQTEILRTLEISTIKNVNLVFVHSVNPWGMAWYRRVNAHNVDLNRNYFPEGAERPQNLDFELFAPLFEKRPQLKKWQIWRMVILNLLRKGIRNSAGIVARGQYHLPESLFYGGSSLEPEIVEVLRVLRGILSETAPLFVVDVHSGLGKFGSENWLLDGHHSEKEAAFWKDCLQAEIVDIRNTKGFYPADGTLAMAFRQTFSQREVSFIFEEFGTRSLFSIFRNLIREHKSFLKLKLDRSRAFLMIASFYPHEQNWRENSIRRGTESYFKIIDSLNKL